MRCSDFPVKAPIAKCNSISIPSSRSARSQPMGARSRSAWDNAGGLVTVQPSSSEKRRRAAVAGGRLRREPHVAKKAPWDGGFVWARTKSGQPWVASAVEGEGCDLFWPCFDNSLVEVGTVTQHIIVPKGLAAPSNGRLLGIDRLPDGRTRWNWRARRPNNYAIAIDVAPYKLAQTTDQSRFGYPCRLVIGTCQARISRRKSYSPKWVDDRLL